MIFQTISYGFFGLVETHPLKYELYNLLFIGLLTIIIPFFHKVYFLSTKKDDNEEVIGRVPFFDYIKGIAIICVIIIHISYFYTFFPPMDTHQTFIHLINAISRFALPIFFISSGILLNPLRKAKDILPFYGRKVLRLLVPYFLVTIVLGLLNGYSFQDFLYKVLSGRILVPYYFVVVLFQLYILFPFLSFIKDKKWLIYLSFVISFVCYLIPDFWSFKGVHLAGQYLFFFVYGMQKRKEFLNYKADTMTGIYSTFVVLIYITLFALFPIRYYNTQLFYGPAVLHLLFMGKKWLTKNAVVDKVMRNIGKASFWIFLLHYQILDFLYGKFFSLDWNFAFKFILYSVLSIVISASVGYVAFRIYSFLSSYIGEHSRT